MKQLDEILREHEFFKDFKPEYLELLAGCATNVVFDEDQYIFHEGEKADLFYVIRHGHVALEIHDPRRGPIKIDTLQENEVLGWSWLFAPYHWHFNAKAIKLTRAIALDGKCLREKCERDHSLGYLMMQRFNTVLADRLQQTRLQVLKLYD
jgi:CRP/FNR family transcriptional regulator, cyclic AMP receptor protein